MKRLKNQSGFTLAETLLTVLILLLVSLIVANGMPAARTAYEKIVIGANAQVMLSTAVTALRDELGTAWQVKKVDDTTIEYFNADTGAYSRISLDTVAAYPSVSLQDYVALDAKTALVHGDSAKQGTMRHLVPDKNLNLFVTYDGISVGRTNPTNPTNYVVTVTGLKVCRQTDGNTILELKDENGTLIDLKIQLLSQSVIPSPTAGT